MLKLGSGNRWDADDKTIYDLRRAQYDDKDITDKKIDMDNLLPQILKSTLLIINEIMTAEWQRWW